MVFEHFKMQHPGDCAENTTVTSSSHPWKRQGLIQQQASNGLVNTPFLGNTPCTGGWRSAGQGSPAHEDDSDQRRAEAWRPSVMDAGLLCYEGLSHFLTLPEKCNFVLPFYTSIFPIVCADKQL